MNINRPTINIYVNHQVEADIKEVLAGLEEEGVLYEVYIKPEESAEKLAHTAAIASILETGIGINSEFICVTLSKMPVGESLLKYRTSEKFNLRLCGGNAARLVKGITLKL